MGRSTLYDETRVQDPAARPMVDVDVLAQACPRGSYVAEALATQPPLPPLTRASINVRIAAGGPLPWGCTISGYYVAFGADATAAFTDGRSRTVFRLREPGDWVDALAGRCLPTGRGRRWVLCLPPLQE